MRFTTLLAILATWLLWHQTVAAGEASVATGKRPVTVGAGALYRDKPYKDYEDSDKWSPFPLVLYEGDRFFVRGGNLGWKFVNTRPWEVAVFAEFAKDGYEESSSDVLDGMDDRDPWIAAGAHVKWQPRKFGIKLASAWDIVQESEGMQATLDAFWQDRSGPWIYNVSGGAVYQSDDYVDYYYGVKSKEEIPGVRPAYSPDEEVNYRLQGVLLYQRPESKWLFALATRYTFLGDEIEDSPIVNDDGELMGLLAIGYTFGR